MGSKYHAKKAELDGITFDSRAEARRYAELKLLLKAGKIKDLELQPAFTLMDSFKGPDGKTIRGIKYIADFKYQEGDRTVIEDVKGMRTQAYQIKRKLFLKLYPEYDFREIQA